MGKKRKHEHNGMMPIDEMPRSSDTFPSSLCDVLLQFKDTIQVKVKTDELLQKLEKRVGMLEEKVELLEEKVKSNESKEIQQKERIKKFKGSVKRERDEFKEEFRLELQKRIQNLENKSKQSLSVFMEDFKKEQKVKEEPSLGIQEDMQEEVCAKGHHYNESSSLRLQPHQRPTTSFHLEFTCKMDTTFYKGKPIHTIEVVLYDGGNQIAPDHHLASAAVELVVIDGEFAGHTQGYWSKDEFLQNIVKLRQGNNSTLDQPKFRVRNGKFQLVGGRSRHEGVIIMENSNRKDVKLGVMIVGDTKERVLEGVSSVFRVQEAKTEKGQVKQNIPPQTGTINLHNMPSQSGMTDHHTSGQGQQYMHKGTRPVGFPNTSNPSEIPYHHTTGKLPLGLQYPTQQDISGVGGYVQRPETFLPAEPNFGIVPNQWRNMHAHTEGYVPVSHSLVDQQYNNTQHGTTQQKGYGQQYMQTRTGPSFPNMANPSEIPYHHTAGNGYVGPLPLGPLQYPTPHDITNVGSYVTVQGLQNTFLRTENNLDIVPNQLQKRHAAFAGNGPGTQPVVEHLQQQNSTRQGSTQQEDHGSDLLALKKSVEGSSTDITCMSPFADNAFEDNAVYREAMRRLKDDAGTGCTQDHPVAPENTYQDGGAIAPAPQSPIEFTTPTIPN